MYYIIYKVTNLINNKFYIGKHQTDNLNDSYMGSGHALLRALKKYGKEKFTKEILYFCETLEEMNLLESSIVDQCFVERRDTYNIVLGGEGGCISLYKENPKYKEICEKISNSQKGKPAWNKGLTKESQEYIEKKICEKISNQTKGRESWNKGLTKENYESVRIGHEKTTETRKKNNTYISKRKGIPLSNITKQKLSEAHKGKTISLDTKIKMSESHKKRATHPDYINPMKGSVGSNKGKTFAKETRKKISDSMKTRVKHPDYINPTKGKHRPDDVKNAIKIAKSNGTYITPWGVFISSTDAAKHPESSFRDSEAIRVRCKKKYKGYNFIPKS